MWAYPSHGWVKVNTDGAAKGNQGIEACGGLIRDESESWIIRFVVHIGICSSFIAELWEILMGLKVAWDRGFRKVIIESDPASIISMLQKKESCSSGTKLVSRIFAWMEGD